MDLKKLFLMILLMFTSVPNIIHADNISEAWKQEELNENFMHNITKDNCMKKTIASIKNCDSDDCLKTLSGINGDCITFATGSKEEFCLNYNKEYISKYCATNQLSARQCIILHVGKSVICK
ncbi:MAG: hypothetical protein PHO27_09215 [Sulfuricurvum sp.]|nr:hypothetical protein [Sulfuricurvum sp.]